MSTIHRKTIIVKNKNSDNHGEIVNDITTKYYTIHQKVQLHQLSGQNIYFNEMKPIFVLMRLIGRFPYSFTKTGTMNISKTLGMRLTNVYCVIIRRDSKVWKKTVPTISDLKLYLYSTAGIASFSLISWPLLYSLVFNLIFGLLTIWSMQKIINEKIYPSQSYDETLFWCLLLLYALQNLTGPITFWFDAPRTVRYFQKWKDFEGIWKCGPMHSVKRLRFIRIYTILLPPMVIIILIYQALTLPKISAFVFVTYAPILMAAVLMLGHWWMTLHNLRIYSETLLTSIFKVKKKHDMGYRRRMWLNISDLVTEIGNVTGASGLSYATTFFVGFILSVYAIMINIASPDSSNVSIWGLVIPAFFSSICYYVAGDAAYRATEQIGPMFTKKLLQIDLSFLHRNCLNEIDLFFNCLSAKSPVIEYLGFMKVTRSTFLHFMSSTMTYLVVLVQMKEHPNEVRINPTQDNSTSYENLVS